MFEKELVKLGLSKGEAQIYTALLKFGDLSASELAKKTKLVRTNVYSYANALLNKGYISEYDRNNKINYSAETPRNLKELVERRQQDLNEQVVVFNSLLPKLEDAFHKTSNRPRVSYYRGEKDWKAVMDKIYLECNHKQVYKLLPDLDFYSPPHPRYSGVYLEKGIRTCLVTNKGQSFVDFQKRDEKMLRRTYKVSEADLRIDQVMVVAGDLLVWGDFEKKSFAVTVLRDVFMADMYRNLLALVIKNNYN